MDLLQKMLSADPKSRITAVQCLQHPYFTSYQAEEEIKLGSPCLTTASSKPKKLVH